MTSDLDNISLLKKVHNVTRKRSSKKKSELLRKLWRPAKFIAKPLILFHLATQAAYIGNDIRHELNPSPLRQEFQETFGFPIKGYHEDVETMDGVSISRMGEALCREKIEGNLDINYVRIESKDYTKRGIMNQLESWVNNSSHVGRYHSVAHGISLRGKFDINEGSQDEDTLHHEVKHAKTFKYNWDEYGFWDWATMGGYFDEWRDIAKGEDGKALYKSTHAMIGRNLKIVGKLYDPDNMSEERCEENGFVSDYSRTHPIEDAAEIGEGAESFTNTIGFKKPELGSGDARIIKKVEKLIEGGALDKGVIDWMNLKKQFYDAHGFQCSVTNSDLLKEFYDGSERFLKEHPESIYVSELRGLRGCIFYHSENTWDGGYDRVRDGNLAKREFKAGLTAKFKPQDAYQSHLLRLEDVSEWLGEFDKAKVYKDAMKKHSDQYFKGDLDLSLTGVNDYLIRRGIDLAE